MIVASRYPVRARSVRLCVAEYDYDFPRRRPPTDPSVAIALLEGEVVRLGKTVLRTWV
jgi:hypothetical protein